MRLTFPLAAIAVAALAAGSITHAQAPRSATLDRIAGAGRIRLGYRGDAKPFSFRDDAGNPSGYSIALCQQVVDAVRTEVRLSSLAAEWVPVTPQDRFAALQRGDIDLLCGADTITIERRRTTAFSIPVFPGGVGVLLRADAPARLREVLSGRGQSFRPTWRAAATQVLQARAFAAVAGSTADSWLTGRIKDLEIVTKAAQVPTYQAGVDAVVARRADALFGERAILLDAARRHVPTGELIVLDRLFTYEPLALALPPGDDAFRLLVDRALTRVYASGTLGALYTTWFGEPDENAITFFRWSAVPD